MFAHRFGRIVLRQGTLKVPDALFELGTQRRLRLFKLSHGVEVGLHLVTWTCDFAPKDACHPTLPLHPSRGLEMPSLMIVLVKVLLCARGQDTIKQKECTGMCNFSH